MHYSIISLCKETNKLRKQGANGMKKLVRARRNLSVCYLIRLYMDTDSTTFVLSRSSVQARSNNKMISYFYGNPKS